MRIARLIFIVLALLGGIGTFLASKRLWVAHQLVLEESQMAELAQARSEWFEGTVALSFERSVTQVALSLDTAIPDAFRELIDQQRQQSDDLLAQSLADIEAAGAFANREAFTTDVARIRSSIATLREEADALLSQTGAQRDAERMRDMPYELKAEIERLFTMAGLLMLRDGRSSTDEMILSRIQALAWEVREFGGRARTFYAIASLSGEPIPERLMGEAYIDTARAVAGWERIQSELRTADLPEGFVSSVRAAEAPFADVYLPALDDIDRAMEEIRAGANTQMPYSFDAFFELSNEGLDAVANIAPLAGQYIQEYWSKELQLVQSVRMTNGLTVVLVLLVTISSIIVIHRKLTRPLAAATQVLNEMAEGDIDRKFRKTRRKLDELRVIWDAMETLSERLRDARDTAAREKEAEENAKQGIIGELVAGLGAMAQGDLTHNIADAYGDAYRELVHNFNETNSKLRDVMSKVIDTTQEITRNSDGLSSAVGDLSQRTEDQMRIVGETTQNLRELVEGLKETAENTKQSLLAISDAAGKSDAGRAVVDTAVSAMDQIRETSDSISGFGSIIDDIAFQTNLLSLNAGVEAARAGDAGKGFAVVAQEVRNLASQASVAAREVKEQVESSKISVKSGVEEVTKTGRSLTEISDMVGTAHGRIGQVDAASREQAMMIDRLGQTMDDIDAITRQNAEMADDAAATSQSLKDTAKALRSAMAQFKLDAAHRGPDDMAATG